MSRGPAVQFSSPAPVACWPSHLQHRRRFLSAATLVVAVAALQALVSVSTFASWQLNHVSRSLWVGVSPSSKSEADSSSGTRVRVVRHAEPLSSTALVTKQPGAGKRLLVLGGNGFVGREVCRLAAARGYQVTSLSRRGENPEPDSKELSAVKWVRGDATDVGVVRGLAADADAVVHAIGLLFDTNSGLANLNLVVSGSKSTPGEDSTYDRITRLTAFNAIEAVRGKFRMPFLGGGPTPVLFVSAAEAGWPDVALGPQVEASAPAWLQQYLIAKRAVEASLQSSPDTIRPVIFRPSLIWSWTKFDVLPVIPIFNILNFLGVPFVDKTVTVSTLSRSIIAGLEDESVSGVQRFMQMEELEKQIK